MRIAPLRALVFVVICFLGLTGSATAQNPAPLQPYIMVEESGVSLERTSKDIIARLFLLNYKLLGRYHPAEDENSEILIVTRSALQAVTSMNPEYGAYASVARIAMHARGDFTFVSIQNMDYWARAYYGDAYPSVAPAISTFMKNLSGALPDYRGRFNRPYGAAGNPLTHEQLRDYRYSRRSEGLDDRVILGTYRTQHAALAAVRAAFAQGTSLKKVYDLQMPDKAIHLFGVSLSGVVSEKVLLDLISQNEDYYGSAFPLEILVSAGVIWMPSLRYRIPLSAPGMTRKNFRKLKKLQLALTGEIKQLLR